MHIAQCLEFMKNPSLERLIALDEDIDISPTLCVVHSRTKENDAPHRAKAPVYCFLDYRNFLFCQTHPILIFQACSSFPTSPAATVSLFRTAQEFPDRDRSTTRAREVIETHSPPLEYL